MLIDEKMHLIITIDTEEDNWGDYRTSGASLQNIQRIPKLQELFDQFGVRPTYLITYPVATDEESVSILKSIQDQDRCEIGAQCHPWNTPPFEEEQNGWNSMLCNLTPDLQYKKIMTLHHAIRESFGREPESFRTGRWGYDRGVAENLCKLGYKVDTSIIAYTDWAGCHGPDFSHIPPDPFRFNAADIYTHVPNGAITEVPATVGYLQANFAICNKVVNFLNKAPFRYLRLIGILDRLRLLNEVWLSPEMSDARSMIALAERMMQNNYSVINMFFHSSALKGGLTPYVKTEDDEREFIHRIRAFLDFSRSAGIESILLKHSVTLP